MEGSRDEQMNWARSINDANNRVLPDWEKQFTELCRTKEFQQIQRNTAVEYIDKAKELADEYNLKSERGFALAFDIAIQNWDISLASDKYIKLQIAQGASEKEVLKLLAEAAVSNSDSDYQEDVRSRKFAIVNGGGHVHGKDYYMEKEFGLTDAPYR